MGIGVAIGGAVRRNTRRYLGSRVTGAATSKAVGTAAGAATTGAIGVGTKNLIDSAMPEQSRSTYMGPQTSLDEEREDEVNLGSDRAGERKKKGSGRKSLMSPQSSGSGSGAGGGLQV